jgi:hypothetical protein
LSVLPASSLARSWAIAAAMTRSTRRGDDLESWVSLAPRASVRITAVFGEWPFCEWRKDGMFFLPPPQLGRKVIDPLRGVFSDGKP